MVMEGKRESAHLKRHWTIFSHLCMQIHECIHLSRPLPLSAILDSLRRYRFFSDIVLLPQFDTM